MTALVRSLQLNLNTHFTDHKVHDWRNIIILTFCIIISLSPISSSHSHPFKSPTKWIFNIISSSINKQKSPSSNSFCLEFYTVSNLSLFHQQGHLLLCRVSFHKKVHFVASSSFGVWQRSRDTYVLLLKQLTPTNSTVSTVISQQFLEVSPLFPDYLKKYLLFTFTGCLLLYQNIPKVTWIVLPYLLDYISDVKIIPLLPSETMLL